METPNKQQEQGDENNSLTPIRETNIDIVGGAGQTDQLEELQDNAKRHDSGEQRTKVPPLDINNGTQEAAATNPNVGYPRPDSDETNAKN